MNIFNYSGVLSCNSGNVEITYPIINGKYYETGYVEVLFLYGNYIGSNNKQAEPPPFTPVMPSNLPFTAELYHAASWNTPAVPAAKDSNASLIAQQDIFDQTRHF